MKKVFLSLVSVIVSATAFAGGLVTNTNQSAAFMRNPARDAIIEVDAAYYNPAGVAFMEDGSHFGFNNQSAFQQRNVKGSIETPTLSVLMDNKEYKGIINSFVIPSVDFTYVQDKWSVSSHFGVPGGGGSCKYDDGLPMFDAMVRGLVFQNATAMGLPAATAIAAASTEKSSFTGQSYLFGWQVGGTYKILDNLSFGAGVRFNYYSAHYEGEVSYNAGTPTSYKLDCSQSGIGFTPIVGLDYKLDKFNFAVKYEFMTCIKTENDTKEFPAAFATVPALNGFKDGVKGRADQPAILTLGAAYYVIPSLTITAGFHYYFDKDADYNGKEKQVDKNTTEYLLGAEYALNDKWLISFGTQFSRYNVMDGYNQNTGFIMSSYSLAGGIRYSINDQLGLNLGCMWTGYDDYEKKSNYGGIVVKEEYIRKSCVPAIGLTWDL